MCHIAERGNDWSLGMRNSAQGEREYGGGQRHDQRPQCESGGHGPQEKAPRPAERFGRAQGARAVQPARASIRAPSVPVPSA